MATAAHTGPFTTKPTEQLIKAADTTRLNRAVGALDLVPLVPLIGAALCIFLMKYLDAMTWLRFGVWLVIGVVIYALYGFRHSKLRSEA